jgi:Transglutaminase-like superfamily
MLARYGLSSRIQLGVRKNGPDKLEGHAWLVCEGMIVTGEGVDEEYGEMPIDKRFQDCARLETNAETPSARSRTRTRTHLQ